MSEEITEFEKAVQDALTAKRLSGTHVQNVTESGTRLLKYDRQIINHLLTTVASLPPKASQRISLLYCTDALCRAVRSLWRRASASAAPQPQDAAAAAAAAAGGQPVYDPRTKAVAQSFLENMEAVIESFVAQLLAPGYDVAAAKIEEKAGSGVEVWVEGKEKMRKIIEIWRKNETFDTGVMERLESLLKELDRIQAKRLVPGLAGLVGLSAGQEVPKEQGGMVAGAATSSGPVAGTSSGTSNGVASLLSLLAAQSTPPTGGAGAVGKATPPTSHPTMGITPPTMTLPAPVTTSTHTPPTSNPATAAMPPDFSKLLSTLTSQAGGGAGSPPILSPAPQSTFPVSHQYNQPPFAPNTRTSETAQGTPPGLNNALAKRDEIARRLAGGGMSTPIAATGTGSPSGLPGLPFPPETSVPSPRPPLAAQSPSTSTSGRQLPVHPDRAALARDNTPANRGWSNDADEYGRSGPGPSFNQGGGYGYRGGSDGPRGRGRGGRGGRGGFSRDFGFDSSRSSGYPSAGREQQGYGLPPAAAPIQSFEDAENNSRRYGITPPSNTERESSQHMRGRAPLPPPQAGKDEFGREVTAEDGEVAGHGAYKRPRSPMGGTGREEDKRPKTDGAVTRDSGPITSHGNTPTPSIAANSGGATLETFNWSSFSPSDGTSWATLGEAWKRSNNGRDPTQQELMFAFMSHQMSASGASGAGAPQQQQMMSMMMAQMMGGTTDPSSAAGMQAAPQRPYRPHDDTHQQARVSWEEEDGPYANFGRPAGRGRGGFRGRGRGRGGFGGGGGGGYGGGQDSYGSGDNEYGTGGLDGSDAVVLGGN